MSCRFGSPVHANGGCIFDLSSATASQAVQAPNIQLPVIPLIENEDGLLMWAKAMAVATEESNEELANAIYGLGRRLATLETYH